MSWFQRPRRVALHALVSMGALLGAAGVQAQSLQVLLSPPKQQNTTVAGAVVETFGTGATTSIANTTGNWAIGAFTAPTGSYTVADQYGGAGGVDRYLRVQTGPITVNVTPGYQYVGFWWSAGDASNAITFYDNQGNQLIRFTTADVMALLNTGVAPATVPTVGGGTHLKAGYYGNPNPGFLGQNGAEPYAYINLLLNNTASTFGKIEIEGSNFELDNLAIAHPAGPVPGTWVPVKDYPIRLAANNDAYATTIGTAVSGNLGANDPPAVPGVPQSYVRLTNPSHGSATVNADGTFTYTPAAGFTGTDSFTYRRCRTDTAPALCDDATVTVTVIDAVNDTNTTNVNAPVGGNVSTNDMPNPLPAGATFAVVSPATAQGGTVTMDASGAYVYTPKTGFAGNDSFSYQLCIPDPNNAALKVCDTATVTIAVRPDAVNDSAATQANKPVTSSVGGNDVGVQPGATFSQSSAPAHGTLAFNADGSYTYTPAAGYTGTDGFTYQLCVPPQPNALLCDTATVTLNVVGAKDDHAATRMDQPVSGNVGSNDGTLPPGGTFHKKTDPAHGTVTFNPDGSYTYTPATGYTGTDSFTYELCTADTPPVCAPATVHINVVGAKDDSALTKVDTPVNGNVGSNDGTLPPGGTFHKKTDPAHGTVTFNPDGSYTYTPATGYSGPDSFTYELCTADTPPVCAPATVDLFVMKAEDDAATLIPGMPLNGSVGGNDKVPPGATFSGPTSGGEPAHGTVTMNPDGTYVYTPSPGYVGDDSFKYQVCAPNPNGGAPVCVEAVVRISSPRPVPTLSQWALLLLSGLMGLSLALRRSSGNA